MTRGRPTVSSINVLRMSVLFGTKGVEASGNFNVCQSTINYYIRVGSDIYEKRGKGRRGTPPLMVS